MEKYLLFQQMKTNIDLLEESFTQQERNNKNNEGSLPKKKYLERMLTVEDI